MIKYTRVYQATSQEAKAAAMIGIKAMLHQGHASHKLLKTSKTKSRLGQVSGQTFLRSPKYHFSAPAGSVSCGSPVLEATGSSAHSAAWPDSLQAPSPKLVSNPQLLHSLHYSQNTEKVKRNSEKQACRKGLACNSVHNKRREHTKQAFLQTSLIVIRAVCTVLCAGWNLHTSSCFFCPGEGSQETTELQREAQNNSSSSLLILHAIGTTQALYKQDTKQHI